MVKNSTPNIMGSPESHQFGPRSATPHAPRIPRSFRRSASEAVTEEVIRSLGWLGGCCPKCSMVLGYIYLQNWAIFWGANGSIPAPWRIWVLDWVLNMSFYLDEWHDEMSEKFGSDAANYRGRMRMRMRMVVMVMMMMMMMMMMMQMSLKEIELLIVSRW